MLKPDLKEASEKALQRQKDFKAKKWVSLDCLMEMDAIKIIGFCHGIRTEKKGGLNN